jgi:CubicO group peptidase (beta-lactamase class C family)
MKTLTTYATLIIFALLTPYITSAQQLTGNETIETALKQTQIPTSVFGYVLKDGKTETMSFGSAIWGEEEKVTADHIFRIASMTKAITSVAAMQLVEQGVIGLDDPLNDLMPEMVTIPILTNDGQLIESDDIITLRHLLTHTSGFGYGFLEKRLQDFNKEGWQFEDLPRMDKPGVVWRYGTSTDWVGKVVEKLSGKTLEDYFRDHITGPLGMHATWFNVPEDLQHLIVSYGTRTESGFREYRRIPVRKVTSYIGGAGLFSSLNDYLKFIHCILNDGAYDGGCILKTETIQQLFNDELSVALLATGAPEEGHNPDELLLFFKKSDRHGLSWGLTKGNSFVNLKNESEILSDDYRNGSAFWGGSYNTRFSIHPKFGYGVVTFHQFSPFADEEAIKLYLMFEQEVNKAIVHEIR